MTTGGTVLDGQGPIFQGGFIGVPYHLLSFPTALCTVFAQCELAISAPPLTFQPKIGAKLQSPRTVLQ